MANEMVEWLFPEDIAARYRVALRTAKKYMREEMRHRNRPLAVTPEAVREWDEARTEEPRKQTRRASTKPSPPRKARKKEEDGKFLIPRTRPT